MSKGAGPPCCRSIVRRYLSFPGFTRNSVRFASHPRHCAMAGAALDPVLLGEYLPHYSRKFGIGKVEQTPIAAHPLKSVQQPSDFPLPVDTREAVLVPAVLSVFAVAAVCSLPMPRHHVDHRGRLVAFDARAEIRILMMAPHRT